MVLVIVEEEGAVLGLNLWHPIVTNGDFVTWLFPNSSGSTCCAYKSSVVAQSFTCFSITDKADSREVNVAQQLTVKAYLMRWNVERKQLELVDETQCFSMDPDIATSYTYLLAKVTNAFPGLSNSPISLYWRGLFFVVETVYTGESPVAIGIARNLQQEVLNNQSINQIYL